MATTSSSSTGLGFRTSISEEDKQEQQEGRVVRGKGVEEPEVAAAIDSSEFEPKRFDRRFNSACASAKFTPLLSSSSAP
ncbi:hypothetical protein U1Q18_014754 [Sarracenia purpurea var. burkii]